MLDVSARRNSPGKAFAYFDGADARFFRALRAKLGSDEYAQNAILLEGLISKLRVQNDKSKIRRVEKLFPRFVGVNYSELQNIIASIA